MYLIESWWVIFFNSESHQNENQMQRMQKQAWKCNLEIKIVIAVIKQKGLQKNLGVTRTEYKHFTTLSFGVDSPIQTISQDMQNTSVWAFFILCATPKQPAQTSLL